MWSSTIGRYGKANIAKGSPFFFSHDKVTLVFIFDWQARRPSDSVKNKQSGKTFGAKRTSRYFPRSPYVSSFVLQYFAQYQTCDRCRSQRLLVAQCPRLFTLVESKWTAQNHLHDEPPKLHSDQRQELPRCTTKNYFSELLIAGHIIWRTYSPSPSDEVCLLTQNCSERIHASEEQFFKQLNGLCERQFNLYARETFYCLSHCFFILNFLLVETVWHLGPIFYIPIAYSIIYLHKIIDSSCITDCPSICWLYPSVFS